MCIMRKYYIWEVFIMNATEKKCMVVEQVCEAVIGGAIGVVLARNVFPKCDDNVEKIIVTLGTGVASFFAGRAFAKKFYKYCDDFHGTDFSDVIEKL